MRAKLKTFNEVIVNGGNGTNKKAFGGYTIYHNKSNNCLTINTSQFHFFGKEINIKEWEDLGDRVIYMESHLPKGSYDALFYDEWFSWIGKSPEHIPAELWDIGDW